MAAVILYKTMLLQLHLKQMFPPFKVHVFTFPQVKSMKLSCNR